MYWKLTDKYIWQSQEHMAWCMPGCNNCNSVKIAALFKQFTVVCVTLVAFLVYPGYAYVDIDIQQHTASGFVRK